MRSGVIILVDNERKDEPTERAGVSKDVDCIGIVTQKMGCYSTCPANGRFQTNGQQKVRTTNTDADGSSSRSVSGAASAS